MTNFGDQLPDLSPVETSAGFTAKPASALSGAVLRIPVSVQVVIGTARIPLSQVAELEPGVMLSLEEKLGTPARMLVNGREVAKGELIVVDEATGTLGLTITEVAGSAGEM